MRTSTPFGRKARTLMLMLLLALLSNCQGQPPPAVPVQEEEPGPTSEWEAAGGRRMQPLIDSIRPLRERLETERMPYFLEHVYEPAVANAQLSEGNRAFLQRLKAYLECPSDSCGRSDKLMRPVFRFERDSVTVTHRIVSDFPYEERDNSYDGSGWGNDTVVTSQMRRQTYRLYYANAPVVKSVHIQDYQTLAGACLYYRSFVLQTLPLDTLWPAFCTTLDLRLKWGGDVLMNELLQDWTRGSNILNFYCDPMQYMRCFAQLEGVPGLCLAIDEYSGWDNSWFSYYPTVGVYMMMDGKWAVPLWMYQVERVGCSCI